MIFFRSCFFQKQLNNCNSIHLKHINVNTNQHVFAISILKLVHLDKPLITVLSS